MKTPREAFKENFWIGAKGGLCDEKHIRKMGKAIWLFLYLLREQTSMNQFGEGVVNYGHPKTLKQISEDLKGTPAESIRRWIRTLKREGYIRVQQHGPSGLNFWIANAKSKTRKVKVTHEDAASMQKSVKKLQRQSRTEMRATQIQSRAEVDGKEDHSRANMDPNPFHALIQPFMNEMLGGVLETPIPKGFTPKNLSYHNKDSHPQTACFPPSLKELVKAKILPRGKTERELDERRRELLLQGERIKRDYPDKWSRPGKVSDIKLQEAIA